MSLLLDALRKADRERRSGQPLSPFDEPPTPDTSRTDDRSAVAAPNPGSQRALLAVLWGILIAVLLLALVVWQRGPEALPTTTVTPTPAAATPTPRPTAAVATAHSTTPDVSSSFEEIYSLDELAMPALQPIDAAPASAAASTPDLTVTEPAPTSSSAFVPPLPTPDSNDTTNAAPDALPDDVVQQRDLPAAVRERIPAYAINVHVYNDDPARRFVLIGGERYGEGSTLDGGHRLLQIAPRGLVIDVDGQKVLIQRPG